MPQAQTLAQKVKAKYPGVYDDIADAELEAKVKAKYPGVYDDVPTTPVATSQPSSGGGLLDTAVEFGKGVLKAPLAIVETGGNLIRSIPGVRQAEEATGAYVDTGINTKPTNTAQTAGRIVGDIATAFVPAGAVTRGAKVAASLAPKLVAPLVRGGVEAAGAGGEPGPHDAG